MSKKARLKLLKKEAEQKAVQQKKQQLEKIITATALAIVVVAIFSLAFTILKPGFPAGHDIAAHLVRSKILKEALFAGQFPVRWVEWVWLGSSYPLFNYYQAGFYYFVALSDLIIPSHIESIKITVLLLWWLGAFFMFLLLRKFGNLPAALGALIYAFTPYIISDVFVRAAYPELGAISFSVGILWSLDRLLRSAKPFYGLILGLTVMGVFTFHLPTLVIMTPLFFSYSLLLLLNQEVTLKGFYCAIFSSLIGIGLTSFYLFPALFELKYIKSELLTSNSYDFHTHFVFPQQLFDMKWGYGLSEPGLNDGMSFQFGIVQWLIIAISLIAIFIPRFLPFKNLKRGLIFGLLMIVYATFFMHNISISFWENWHFISFIQYPWRFLMVVAISTSLLAALLLANLKTTLYKSIATITCLALIFIFYRGFLAPATFVPKSDFDIDAPDWQTKEGILVNSFVEEGYLPKEVEIMADRGTKRWEVVNNITDPPNLNFDPGTTPWVEEKKIYDHQLSFITKNDQPFILRLNVHYFPGWQVLIDNQQTEIYYNNPYDFMNVYMPAGTHQIEARFTNTPLRSFSNIFTIISLLILIIWQLSGLKFFKKRVDSV